MNTYKLVIVKQYDDDENPKKYCYTDQNHTEQNLCKFLILYNLSWLCKLDSSSSVKSWCICWKMTIKNISYMQKENGGDTIFSKFA